MEKIFAADMQSSESICKGIALCDSSNAGSALGQMVGKGINLVLMVGGLIALFYLLWAGINWIQSEGDKEKLATAKHKMTNAIIGLIILFSVWTIWTLVVTSLKIFKSDGSGGVQIEIPSLVK